MPDFFSDDPPDDMQDDADENEFDNTIDLGIPERFDPGYHSDITALARICGGCGESFFLCELARRRYHEAPELCDTCPDCLREIFEEISKEAEETQEIVRRLGMTMDEYFELELRDFPPAR